MRARVVAYHGGREQTTIDQASELAGVIYRGRLE